MKETEGKPKVAPRLNNQGTVDKIIMEVIMKHSTKIKINNSHFVNKEREEDRSFGGVD